MEVWSRQEQVMEIRDRLLGLVFLRVSFRCLFAGESNAWPERDAVFSPMLIESGSVVGSALSVRDVPQWYSIFCEFEH